MSKQSEAKEKQGYIPKLKPRACINCASYAHDEQTLTHAFGSFVKSTNQRCAIGGFAVKKMGTCNEFLDKPPTLSTTP